MNLVLNPAIALPIVLLASGLIYLALSPLTFKRRDLPGGLTKAYACGEDMPERLVRPDYGQFFPFAFFFTILHVVSLMATTVPVERVDTFLMALLYVIGALVGLSVLYRR